MTLFNTLSKKALITAMIAATGLPASMAAAQFKVEYSAKADTAKAHAHDDKKSVMVYTDHDDEHVYKIKIVDGVIELANLDGKELDHKLVEIKDNIAVFLSDDGGVLHEIKLHKMHNEPHAPHAIHIDEKDGNHTIGTWSSSTGGNFELKEGSNAFFAVSGGPEDNEFVVDVKHAAPKVMLGINLGEPSKILRKHLKLKDGVQVILVERVIEGLPAAKAGLEEFDVIVSIDGSDQANGEILGKVLSEKEIGDNMKLVVLRSGDKLKIKVKLVEYDANALGTVEILAPEVTDWADANGDFEFEFLTKLEEGQFGEFRTLELEKLKEEVRKQFDEQGEQHIIVEQMRAKAMDAMKDAERQMLEFRDGKLFVHAPEGVEGLEGLEGLKGHLYEALESINPEVIESHMDELESRLEELESRLEEQMDRMSEQMDRLANMFERLMDSLEDRD